jgi:hypothetical protein
MRDFRRFYSGVSRKRAKCKADGLTVMRITFNYR